ncbi:MAG: hypothetical protein GY855_00120 [candidate division Zixibacteria bacterium]|nr:hypothetical protein [candidate division Zixibacteria bacterium]
MSVVYKVLIIFVILTGTFLLSDASAGEAQSGQLIDFVDVLQDSAVGERSEHSLSFIIENTIPRNGKINFDFRGGFDLGLIQYVQLGIIDSSNWVFIDSFYVDDQTISVILNPNIPAIPPNSHLEIRLNQIINDTTAGSHFVLAWTTTSRDSLIDGPSVSQSYNLVPNRLERITIIPSQGLTIPAGGYILFLAYAYDIYGNNIEYVNFSWVVSPDSCGAINTNGVFAANKVGECYVYVSAQGVSDTSGLVTVIPGAIADFEFSNVPIVINAGHPFPNSVGVLILDAKGNRKTNFPGNIHFTSSDPNAHLFHDFANPYQYTVQDSGYHAFDGDQFAFRTAGIQTIRVHYQNVYKDTYGVIVNPDSIASFEVSDIQGTVLAGEYFALGITNAEDSYGNIAEGIISVLGGPGVEPSPGGFEPELNDVVIFNGEGLANQRIFKSGNASIIVNSRNYYDTTNTFPISPSLLNELKLSVSSPQISGLPFYNDAFVEAIDRYGNLKTDMDASTDSVKVAALDFGLMDNNKFSESTDFEDGICDLTQHGTIYYGPGYGHAGWMGFIAVSPSVSDTARSNPVAFISLDIRSTELTDSLIFAGDTTTALVEIENSTTFSIELDSIYISSASANNYPTISQPELPRILTPDDRIEFSLQFVVPLNADYGLMPVKAKSFANYNNIPVINTLPTFQDTGFVAVHKKLRVIDASLQPDSVTLGYPYSFSVDVVDSSDYNIVLDDSSYILFSDLGGTWDYKAYLPHGLELRPSEQTTLIFEERAFNIDFSPGVYQPDLHLFGILDDYQYLDEIIIFDTVYISPPAGIHVIDNSLNPDSVVTGHQASHYCKIANTGTAAIDINNDSTSISFTDGVEVFTAFMDTSDGRNVDILLPGDTTFYFVPEIIPETFEAGLYMPVLHFRGYQNEVIVDTLFGLYSDSISVFRQARIRIDSTFIRSPNAPYVNSDQLFFVRGWLTNSGTEGIRDLVLRLDSDGGSQFPDSLLVEYLPGLANIYVDYVVTAGQDLIEERFELSVSSGIGEISESEIIIEPSTGNNVTAVIQSPAEINISLFQISDNNDEPPYILTTGQNFIIESVVDKQGQSEVSGIKRLVIDAQGFSVADSLQRVFTFGDTIQWEVSAPADTGTYLISVRIADEIVDLNDSLSAIGQDSTASFGVMIVPGSTLSGVLEIIVPIGAIDGVLSTNQSFVVKQTAIHESEILEMSATITLPPGYSTQDLTKPIANDTVSWVLEAPNFPDDAIKNIGVQINGIDPVSEEPVSFNDRVDVFTINAADIRTKLDVAEPGSAKDYILDPLQEFTVVFTCENYGQAGVYPGLVELNVGESGFELLSQRLMEFGEGQFVSFSLRAPEFEISEPVDIYACVVDIPDDSNTNSAARFSNDSLLQFVVKDLKPDLVLEDYEGFTGQGVAGTEITALKLEFFNRDNGSSYPISIGRIEFFANDQDGRQIGFSNIASEIRLIDSDEIEVYGIVEGNSAVFIDMDSLVIGPGNREDITFYIMLADNITTNGFSLKLNSAGIDAYAVRDGLPQVNVNTITVTGDPLDIVTNPAGLTAQNLRESFGNYPNPFDPNRQVCQFTYFLSKQSDISMRIYTLTGQPVWAVDYRSNDEHCQQGNHSGSSTLAPIIWDGRNGNGYIVNNGVYITEFRMHATGEYVRTKVAVVK